MPLGAKINEEHRDHPECAAYGGIGLGKRHRYGPAIQPRRRVPIRVIYRPPLTAIKRPAIGKHVDYLGRARHMGADIPMDGHSEE